MRLSGVAEGRTISLGFHIRLTPPEAQIGETDSAAQIGHALISQTMRNLKQAAESEGFAVEIFASNVVY